MKALVIAAVVFTSVVAQAQSPLVGFKDAKLREQVGDKTKDTDAALIYNDTALVIHHSESSIKRPRILKTLPYADITGAEYTFGKSPRVTAALLVSPLFLFNSSKSHWLTVQTATDYAVVRLDKKHYKLVLAELEKRAGITVEAIGEDK